MKKTIILFLFCCAILLLIPSCADPYAYEESKVNCSLSGMELYEIKALYEAAGEGEEAFNAKIEELGSKSKCTRDEFLTAYNYFKDQVVVVPNSKRFMQYDFSFDYAGTEIHYMDAPTQTTSVDMVCQTFAHRITSYYGDCRFYGSSSIDPIYEEPFTEMINDGRLVDAYPITSEDLIQFIDKDGYRIEAYVEPYPSQYEPSSDTFYLFVYHDDVYVGFFHIIGSNADPDLRFKWPDFKHFDFMTLEQAIQTAENFLDEE